MKFFMMVGLPASGKSFYAERIAKEYKAKIFSSDDYRAKFGESNEDQSVTPIVFKELLKDIKGALEAKENVIFDATNVVSKKRRYILNEIKKYNPEKICVLIMRRYEKCLEFNAKRERKVPEFAIKKMYLSFDIPYLEEGWDKIHVIYSDNDKKILGDPFNYIDNTLNYNQDNKHHTLTLGYHSLKTYKNMDIKINEKGIVGDKAHNLLMTALMHDCGKPFCKDFRNSKGEESEDAHYYGHEHVGAYDIMFYNLYNFNKMDIAFLINYHMKPHQWIQNESKKSPERYLRVWGKDKYDDVMLLAECDNDFN